ncbi:pilin [Nanoarchaeota archaeon]
MKWLLLCILVLATMPMIVSAEIDFDATLTPAEEQAFDEILSPVMKIYNFIKYAVTVLCVLMLVFAGISFAMSGGDQGKKDRAKNTAVGVVIGLILVWVAPLIVQFMIS